MRALIATLVFFAIASGTAMAAGDAAAGKAKFEIMCATCHGPLGHGDGPAAVALNPKPRNFGDKEWQKATKDERIKAVVNGGGASVGLSPMMPALGPTMTPADLDNIIAFIRSLGK